MADAAPAVELDAQYRAIREEAAVLERPAPALIGAAGPDAAEFLQGQLTNDVEGLSPGEGSYAALLDRKGHVQADMRALRVADEEFLLVSDAAAGPALFRHLSTYKLASEVELAERDGELALISVLGPRAPEIAAAAGLGPEHAHRGVSLAGAACTAVATDAGVDLLCPAADASAVLDALLEAGAEPISEDAAEIARIESGRPSFAGELAAGPMPAEAGIVERAINFEKGCYIGQEPVARLHYRGKPNRVLRGLRLGAPAEAGAALTLGDRELGTVGSACVSPVNGPIALAIVRREAEPGTSVEVAGSGPAEVVDLPF